MIEVYPGEERGLTEQELLRCRHTFSFAEYQDDERMGFHSIRVANEDILMPGAEVLTHPHQNIELLTYVARGSLKQKDSVGELHEVGEGQFQLLSAGTGILHSEFNDSKDTNVHSWQFWVFPHSKGLSPTNQLKQLYPKERQNKLVCLASASGEGDSLIINQNMKVHLGHLNSERICQYKINQGRVVWLQVISGSISINEMQAKAGDGLAITDEQSLSMQALEDGSEFFLFDLAPKS